MTQVITRDIYSDDYFTAPHYRDGDILRYLVATDRSGDEYFVIFVNATHKQKLDYFGFETVISAGYIQYEPEIGFYCMGESTTLHVRARKVEDTQILHNWIAETPARLAEKERQKNR